jgi:hypothetical protein
MPVIISKNNVDVFKEQTWMIPARRIDDHSQEH